MIKLGLCGTMAFACMLLQSAHAQKIAIGLSPFAGVVSVAHSEVAYSNAYNIFVEFFKTDSSRVHFQVRYDYFESSNNNITGMDNSFQNLGVGASVRILNSQHFQLVGCGSVGFILTRWGRNHWGYFPSSTNLTLGCRVEWLIKKRVAPFIESSLLNSIKLNADEKTRVELFALRIGVRVQ
jgi:hypothetical protein